MVVENHEDEYYCDTELCLGAGNGNSNRRKRPTALDIVSYRPPRVEGWTTSNMNTYQQQQQQLTIFYGGRICVCDTTEIQARAIISMAQRESGRITSTPSSYLLSPATPISTSPTTPLTPQLLQSGSSMKKSLQHFLQQRKSRANTCSPRNHDQNQLPSPPPPLAS